MVQTEERPNTAFAERFVEADGFRIRYMEGGQGEPVVHLHGGGGMRLSRMHDLLAEHYRMLAFEIPGFGQSPANETSRSMQDLAATMARAVANVGVERYNLVGTSFGAKVALWQAIQAGENIDALVLLSSAALVPEEWAIHPDAPPDRIARMMYAHPENLPPRPPVDPAVAAKHNALVNRVFGLNRDPELESKLPEIEIPTLVVYGTNDGLIPPEMGRIYREKMPNCSFVLVYDAAHLIDVERPEALAGVVGDFLERHETFIVGRGNTVINP